MSELKEPNVTNPGHYCSDEITKINDLDLDKILYKRQYGNNSIENIVCKSHIWKKNLCELVLIKHMDILKNIYQISIINPSRLRI